MSLFDTYPTYSRYRTLSVTEPLQHGEDVYALQTALDAEGFEPGPFDGILGRGTGAAIRRAQVAYGLTIDGLAGGRTQEALARAIAKKNTTQFGIAAGALRGQLEHESGFRVGNYSAARPDGSYDAGVAQRNTAHTPAQDGFMVPDSIAALAHLVSEHHKLFAGLPARRRWALAQGAWNAPAYACWIARAEGATNVPLSRCKQPGSTARQLFEAYVSSVSTYLTV